MVMIVPNPRPYFKYKMARAQEIFQKKGYFFPNTAENLQDRRAPARPLWAEHIKNPAGIRLDVRFFAGVNKRLLRRAIRPPYQESSARKRPNIPVIMSAPTVMSSPPEIQLTTL